MHFLRYRQSLHAALSSDLIISLALENLACHYNVTISTDIEDLLGHLQIVEHYRTHFEPCKECMVEFAYSTMTVSLFLLHHEFSSRFQRAQPGEVEDTGSHRWRIELLVQETLSLPLPDWFWNVGCPGVD